MSLLSASTPPPTVPGPLDERAALADLLAEVGPDQPTLCEGWQTRDLAVHLLLRERRPWLNPALDRLPVLGAARGRALDEVAQRPWAELVGALRAGPPAGSPLRSGLVQRTEAASELFTHHEDVRRARSGWEPRPLSEEAQETLWKGLRRTARLTHLRCPVALVLRRPDGQELRVGRGAGQVVLVGEPAELLLHAFRGRSVARVETLGSESDVAALDAYRP